MAILARLPVQLLEHLKITAIALFSVVLQVVHVGLRVTRHQLGLRVNDRLVQPRPALEEVPFAQRRGPGQVGVMVQFILERVVHPDLTTAEVAEELAASL